MSQGGNNATIYYKVIERFKYSEWKQFARQKLELSDTAIDEIEHDARGVKEQKYQMITAWEQKGTDKNPALLLRLVDQFYGRGTTQEEVPERSITVPQPAVPVQTPHKMRFRELLLKISRMMSTDEVNGLSHLYSCYTNRRHFPDAMALLFHLDDNNVLGDTSTPDGVQTALTSLRTNIASFRRQDIINEIDTLLSTVQGHGSIAVESERRNQGPAAPHSNYAQSYTDAADAKGFGGIGKDEHMEVEQSNPGFPSTAVQATSLTINVHDQGTGIAVHQYQGGRRSIQESSSSIGGNYPSMESTPVQETAAPPSGTRMEAGVADPCTFVGEMLVENASWESYNRHMKNDEVYTIGRRPKGKVLVLSNTKGFVWGKNHDRLGGEKDVKLMRELWTQMQCEVIVHSNKTIQEMKKILSDFSQDPGHQLSSLCVVIIMTHGGYKPETGSVIYGTCGYNMKAETVLRYFDNDKCEHLAHKPKLFFFQACRGIDGDRGVVVDDLTETLSHLLPRDQTDADGQQHLPTRTDMLVAYATLQGNKAFRDMKTGSWFINAIANVFMRSAKNTHVADMLTKVKSGLITRTSNVPNDPSSHGCKEMAEVQDLFIKSLYLFPGLP